VRPRTYRWLAAAAIVVGALLALWEPPGDIGGELVRFALGLAAALALWLRAGVVEYRERHRRYLERVAWREREIRRRSHG
jgi:drug/metabolite transporter (DMT)-like permease